MQQFYAFSRKLL